MLWVEAELAQIVQAQKGTSVSGANALRSQMLSSFVSRLSSSCPDCIAYYIHTAGIGRSTDCIMHSIGISIGMSIGMSISMPIGMPIDLPITVPIGMNPIGRAPIGCLPIGSPTAKLAGSIWLVGNVDARVASEEPYGL